MTKAEQYIQDCTRHCSNELCAIEDKYGKSFISYYEWLTPDQARRAVEIAIEDACEWIKQQQEMLEDCFSDAGDFADLLKQAMKE